MLHNAAQCYLNRSLCGCREKPKVQGELRFKRFPPFYHHKIRWPHELKCLKAVEHRPIADVCHAKKSSYSRGEGEGEADVDGCALKPQMLSAETVAVCNREGGVGGRGGSASAKRN